MGATNIQPQLATATSPGIILAPASGLDENLPAASAQRVGQIYCASDTQARYLYRDASTREVMGVGRRGPLKATIGPSVSAATYVSATLAGAQPQCGPGTTMILGFYATAVPSGAEVITHCGGIDGTARGWILATGIHTDKGAMSLYASGGGGAWMNFPACTVTGALNQLHVIGLAITAGGGCHAAWGAAGLGQTITPVAFSGTYQLPAIGDYHGIGSYANGTAPAVSSQFAFFVHVVGVMSDAALIAATVAAYNDWHVGDLGFASTCSLYAAHYPEWAPYFTASNGELYTVTNTGASAGKIGVRKWDHT